ncbi:Nn.00g069960.m01.CDS01 [Neocucurbitaria sp. VM-36]
MSSTTQQPVPATTANSDHHNVKNVTVAAAAGVHDFKNVKAALACNNIDRILAGASDGPIRIHGSQNRMIWRRKVLGGLQEALRRIQRKYQVLYPGPAEPFRLLWRSLSSVLEQHAAYKTRSCTKDEYKTEIKVLRDELQSLIGEQPVCRDPQPFLQMIAPWVLKVSKATAHPILDAMDARPTSQEDTAWIPPMNAAVETASRRAGAMDTEQTFTESIYSTPNASTPEDGIELSEEEVKALQPEEAKCVKLRSIPYILRRQALAYICKRVKRMNSLAKGRNKVRLQDNQIPVITKMMEIEVLKDIGLDMKDIPSPTSQQVESEYRTRVESKYEKCGIFAKFLRKVKWFHSFVRKVQDGMEKTTSKLSCFGHRHKNLSQSTVQHQQTVSSSPTDQAKARELLFAALRDTISGMNTNVSNSHNNGQSVLRSDQIEDMARKLEALIAGELNKKLALTPMNYDQRLDEYVRMGKDLINKLNDLNFFVTTVNEYFALQS